MSGWLRTLRDFSGCVITFVRDLADYPRISRYNAQCFRVAKQGGEGADLHEACFHLVSLAGANLQGANLSRARLIKVDLHEADLTEANLSSVICFRTDLHKADLGGANLSHAHMNETNLHEACLRAAKLQWASFIAADLRDADLSGADLTKARIWYPGEFLPFKNPRTEDMKQTTLAGADLTGAQLVAADLTGADLTGATLTGVVADARTQWPEGFDPAAHGIEIPPISSEWRLEHGTVLLGTLQNCTPALPWFRCDFTATAAFDELRPLFDESARLRKARQWEELHKTIRATHTPGLRLQAPHGKSIDDFTLFIDGDSAEFRY